MLAVMSIAESRDFAEDLAFLGIVAVLIPLIKLSSNNAYVKVIYLFIDADGMAFRPKF